MPRLSDVLVLITYAMIAIVAALSFDRFGLLSTQLSWLMGAVVFLIAGQVHAAAARLEERRALENDIHELKASNLSLLEELEDAHKRIDEISIQSSQPAHNEFEALDLTETIPTQDISADQELITELIARLEAAGVNSAANTEAPIGGEVVRAAIEANRIDLYLQPIVNLPQRRVKFYEAFTRMRDASGQTIMAGEFVNTAEDQGLIGEVDNMLLFRCVQLIRGMSSEDRKTGIFCNISPTSLDDEAFFADFLDFLRRQGNLAKPIIFELSQKGFDGRTAVAARNMARLQDYGFRFSLDQVTDLNVDLAELQRAGIGYLKTSAHTLIEAGKGYMAIARREPGAIRPEDMGALFARYGIDLMADKIERESDVVEVLDLDIGYGQGHLFSPPRAIRADVLDSTDAAELRAAG